MSWEYKLRKPIALSKGSILENLCWRCAIHRIRKKPIVGMVSRKVFKKRRQRVDMASRSSGEGSIPTGMGSSKLTAIRVRICRVGAAVRKKSWKLG